ncbi:MAG TPA: serine hydrolase domain-containing protein [Steroidobacteraceae bacterium]|nr:serine hydrolase domain-containing protein [Steroidobacteraceae bacterium]
MQCLKLALSLLLLALPSLAGAAAALSADEVLQRLPQIDAFVQAEMQREKVPGIALGIVSHATVVASKGYGLASVELRVPVSEATLFQSGSLGKQFTAVLVMLQVEDGKLRLEDPLTRYFHDAPRSWQAITVRNLLNHTSGIADYTDYTTEQVSRRGGPSIDLRRDYSEEELVKLAYRLPLEFPPGSRWKYSNTGYLLLGVLVHKVSGKFYGEVLRERVFVPLRMGTARVMSEADIIPDRAAGYRLVKGELKNQEWVSPTLNTTADGALYLSVRDWLAWDRGLRAQAILQPGSWAEVYTPVTLSNGTKYPYGFGWDVDEAKGQPFYHHDGAWQGFTTTISRYLADDLTIVVLTNLAEASPERFVQGIVALIDPELAKGKRR